MRILKKIKKYVCLFIGGVFVLIGIGFLNLFLTEQSSSAVHHLFASVGSNGDSHETHDDLHHHVSGYFLNSMKPQIEKFLNTFGKHLHLKFSSRGRLISITSSSHESRIGSGLDEKVSQEALVQRAQQVIGSAEGLLGVAEQIPLELAPYSRTPSQKNSFHILIFEERSSDHVPLFFKDPKEGQVTLKLKSDGELLILRSHYVPDINFQKDVKLTEREAFEKAKTYFQDQLVPMLQQLELIQLDILGSFDSHLDYTAPHLVSETNIYYVSNRGDRAVGVLTARFTSEAGYEVFVNLATGETFHSSPQMSADSNTCF